MLSSLAPAPALVASLDPLWSAATGSCLTVAADGVIVYEAAAGSALPPASAVKVVTAAAALSGLGDATRFRTAVRTAASPVEGVVAGDLWLIGGGDPVLGSDAWAATTLDADSPRTSLDRLADAVVASGVRVITGRILGDESRYDAVRTVPTWPARLLDDGEVGPLSALVVNDGFAVWGHPGVPFGDPATDATTIFADMLVARGVQVQGGSGSGVAPEGLELAAIESPTVGELSAAMLRDSDNGTAELLVKELGWKHRGDGSTAAGLAVVTDLLRSKGISMQGESLGDGSGLSDANLVSCRLLTAVLTTWRTDIDVRLPRAGRDGTLRRRLVGTTAEGRVRAKTGSLRGVSSLAGYVEAADGRTLSFAAIVTGSSAGSVRRSVIDSTVEVLATS